MKELESELMQFMTKSFKSFGLPDLMVKVMAVLFFEPSEISLDDIAKKTGYSPASISNTIKMIENMGTITRTKKPGSKKVFVYMEKDLISLNIKKLIAAQELYVKPAKMFLPEIIQKYKKKGNGDKERLKIVENYYDQIVAFEQIMSGWKKDLEELSKKHGKI